jgi:phosphopentomutase
LGQEAITAGSGPSHGIAVDAATRAILDERSPSLPWKADHVYRADAQTTRLALAYVRAAHPNFLHVALGDTDEAAHAGDYAGYLRALAAADAFVGDLFATLDELGEYGAHTTVIVTADHGRGPSFIAHDRAPEASRVWLLAAGGVVPRAGLVATRQRYSLSQVAPTIRALLAVPRVGDRPIRDLL